MATDGGRHPLSMKVMRVSRPSLTPAWTPFFSSSPSLSAHSTASVLSLQGTDPLPDHPKTLRDLTHAPTILTLPASFGAIQLGETFSSCVSVNNEVNVDVRGVTLTVEMQTATSKTILGEVGGPEYTLKAGAALDTVVSHEIKELGQHVLACAVSYRLPPHFPAPAPPSIDSREDPAFQTFRKFYKFGATNPLSVKTKVHAPRSPTALFNSTERDKIFLEVHVQNLTQEIFWLEKMHLDAVDNWSVIDINDGIFNEATALMHPQDMRQYIYILTPANTSDASNKFPVPPIPGSIIPLGRLDISWRSSFGEPGRLLTSVLSRRIPPAPVPSIPPPPPPKTMSPPPNLPNAPSAIPTYLQKSGAAAAPPRPRSPHQTQSIDYRNARSPPPQPYAAPVAASPLRRGSVPASRSQSPVPGVPPRNAPTPPPPRTASPIPNAASRDDIELSLVVKNVPYNSITVEEPFQIACVLSVSTVLPLPTNSLPASSPGPTEQKRKKRRERIIRLVAQHVQQVVRSAADKGAVDPNVSKAIADAMSPARRGSASISSIASRASTPSPTATPVRGTFDFNLTQRLLVASPRSEHDDTERAGIREGEGEEGHDYPRLQGTPRLPKPVSFLPEGTKMDTYGKLAYVGSSAIFLPSIRLLCPTTPPPTVKQTGVEERGESVCEFSLSYMPLELGFAKVGGLRILLVSDCIVETEEGSGNSVVISDAFNGMEEARTLIEWDAIAEVSVD